MKIVADDKIPFLKGLLEPFVEVVYIPGSKISKKDILDADALIIRTRTKCKKELLEGTKVKFIASATIGYDHIDREYCKNQNIFWTNSPGCNSGSVQQYILSALFYLADKHKFSLPEKSIGIIGVGNVGKKVEDFARKLGMKVLLNDPPRAAIEGNEKFVSFDDILNNSDIITLHLPLTKEGIHKTYHMFDQVILEKLPKHVILINSSRGEIVDNNALKSSLKYKKIAGAVIDVWENEPEIDKELLNLVDIGTPHIAGYSLDGKANGTAMSVHALSQFFNLKFDNWYPGLKNISDGLILDIDAKNLSKIEVLKKITQDIYNIKADDERLRKNPDTFEMSRGNYPVRREMFNYTIKIKNTDNEEALEFLKKFNLNLLLEK